MTAEIRTLGPKDVTAWREIRLEGLRTMPEAFLTTYEEERARSDAEVAERLSQGAIRGAYVDGTLAAVLAYVPMTAAAAIHRGEIGAFYARAGFRGTGVASALLRATVAEAVTGGVKQLELFVAEDNFRAITFYERHGFRWQGRLPRAVRLGDRWQDDHFYVLRLD
ncbi:N-acetyltransferase family protein [Aestuariibius sp. 2305UL40-4]|uniref:GNAT family N-acetyltransferase n=1 Tax=Aestuariibius violaceus TaxID=3234132 RepID=UPI00345EA37B